MANDTLTLVEFDGATGLETIRPLTADELEERKEIADLEKASLASIQSKAEAKVSALAKLAALGLTEEEIAAL